MDLACEMREVPCEVLREVGTAREIFLCLAEADCKRDGNFIIT